MSELFHKLLILRTSGIGPVKYQGLIKKFGSPVAAAESLKSDQKHSDSVLREMDAAAKLGIEYICDDDPRYPQKLLEIKNHPPVLSVRGNTDTLQKPAIGMVGTRNATAAGMKFISDMACAFAENNYAVVSGMAMGTDTAAAMGALRAGGNTQTIAVLGGGVDYIWPLENEKLYHYIIERGIVVSEMPVGSVPSPSNFIQRNRWISGIAESLVLGEADEKSGSMATAEFALSYGRPVFAIPSHPSDARSIGPNRLIKEGQATLCMGVDDFFGSKKSKNNARDKNISNCQNPQNDVLDKLGIIPVSESVLTGLVKKSIAEIKRDLIMLELGGKIKKVDTGYIKL
ncbi:MAG: DNA-processing protein DprA [Rickettsiales bacterium]|jgi:DNA processing protein|nr:DNA-processing protein DprA [Rickettsiales bacterium]